MLTKFRYDGHDDFVTPGDSNIVVYFN